ncbi:MAG: thioredoxin family protein [Acidobacteria bacterium]|nr:thioredoxin family protein [Acidobacteriota bacterium]
MIKSNCMAKRTLQTLFIIKFSLLLVFTCFPVVVSAQNPASWRLESEAKGKSLKQNETFKAKLKAEIEGEWHLYALEQPEGGPIATTIKISEEKPFKINGKVASPEPVTKFDPNFNIDTKFYEKQVDFDLPVQTTSETRADELAISVRFQLCNDTLCLPPKTVRVTFDGFEEVKKGNLWSVVGGQQNENSATPNPSINNQQLTTDNRQPTTDLWSFLWLAVSLGALSLLTPCVFPMIPITVSYFTNNAAGHRAKAVKLATVYSLGIVLTFTLLGMLLAIFVGAAGINLFAANPWVNLLIAGIFLFFAFNLFGAYEIQIPTGVLTKLDNLTRSKEGEGSGIVGALLMGLTFTLTSFTCTSPFVGTILVSAANGNWQKPLVGMLAFSAVFALPFFVLALLPQYVSQLPRAGGWMNSIKVAMGFLEIAAAMKFLSNVDLIWKWGIFTRNFVLAIWISIGAILAVYLLGKFQLPHDTKPERIGAFRVLSAILSLAISFYLLTGLFGARLGELESFLPPETETSKNFFNQNKTEKLVWIENDYEKALAQANAENKRVFVDFTGYTCTHCRWMEANVFPKSEVEVELSKFVLAKLYTQTVALPFYAIMDADGKTVATFSGLTRNAQEFVDFLQKAKTN